MYSFIYSQFEYDRYFTDFESSSTKVLEATNTLVYGTGVDFLVGGFDVAEVTVGQLIAVINEVYRVFIYNTLTRM